MHWLASYHCHLRHLRQPSECLTQVLQQDAVKHFAEPGQQRLVVPTVLGVPLELSGLCCHVAAGWCVERGPVQC